MLITSTVKIYKQGDFGVFELPKETIALKDAIVVYSGDQILVKSKLFERITIDSYSLILNKNGDAVATSKAKAMEYMLTVFLLGASYSPAKIEKAEKKVVKTLVAENAIENKSPYKANGSSTTGTLYGWSTSTIWHSLSVFLQYFGISRVDAEKFEGEDLSAAEIKFYCRDKRNDSIYNNRRASSAFIKFHDLQAQTVASIPITGYNFNFFVSYNKETKKIRVRDDHTVGNEYGSIYAIALKNANLTETVKKSEVDLSGYVRKDGSIPFTNHPKLDSSVTATPESENLVTKKYVDDEIVKSDAFTQNVAKASNLVAGTKLHELSYVREKENKTAPTGGFLAGELPYNPKGLYLWNGTKWEATTKNIALAITAKEDKLPTGTKGVFARKIDGGITLQEIDEGNIDFDLINNDGNLILGSWHSSLSGAPSGIINKDYIVYDRDNVYGEANKVTKISLKNNETKTFYVFGEHIKVNPTTTTTSSYNTGLKIELKRIGLNFIATQKIIKVWRNIFPNANYKEISFTNTSTSVQERIFDRDWSEGWSSIIKGSVYNYTKKIQALTAEDDVLRALIAKRIEFANVSQHKDLPAAVVGKLAFVQKVELKTGTVPDGEIPYYPNGWYLSDATKWTPSSKAILLKQITNTKAIVEKQEKLPVGKKDQIFVYADDNIITVKDLPSGGVVSKLVSVASFSLNRQSSSSSIVSENPVLEKPFYATPGTLLVSGIGTVYGWATSPTRIPIFNFFEYFGVSKDDAIVLSENIATSNFTLNIYMRDRRAAKSSVSAVKSGVVLKNMTGTDHSLVAYMGSEAYNVKMQYYPDDKTIKFTDSYASGSNGYASIYGFSIFGGPSISNPEQIIATATIGKDGLFNIRMSTKIENMGSLLALAKLRKNRIAIYEEYPHTGTPPFSTKYINEGYLEDCKQNDIIDFSIKHYGSKTYIATAKNIKLLTTEVST